MIRMMLFSSGPTSRVTVTYEDLLLLLLRIGPVKEVATRYEIRDQET